MYPATPAPRRLFGGCYDKLQVIGVGASAIVHRASDRRLSCEVALKVSRSADPGEDDVIRFLRAAKILSALHHPNIPRIFHCGEDGKEHIFVTVLCSGVPATDLTREHDVGPEQPATTHPAKIAGPSLLAQDTRQRQRLPRRSARRSRPADVTRVGLSDHDAVHRTVTEKEQGEMTWRVWARERVRQANLFVSQTYAVSRTGRQREQVRGLQSNFRDGQVRAMVEI
ncbi:Protein kinase domain-containing protein [Nannocystis exedens]|uniref:Protein kinase domain-containing protein n=2 Tax=Nannocystis exedens TaxID=54 RepID=A0A1I2HHZ6_9BACT|nr:Serine/threonine-protein kinase PrkC [Nannocystis exedens]SFF29309.1 Protein kinase domain-containing protein [Nannocystis exedens]